MNGFSKQMVSEDDPYLYPPFENEEQRRDYYKSRKSPKLAYFRKPLNLGNLDLPPFSSLNADVIPKASFLESLDKHQPKFDPELIKEIWKTVGVQTSDERLFKLASSMLEVQMLKIITELRAVAPKQLNSDKELEPKSVV